MRKRVCVAAVAVISAWAAARPDLSGTWQLDPSRSQMTDLKVKSRTLAINQQDGAITMSDTIVDTSDKSRKVDIQCTTDGQDCKATGVVAKVSFYYIDAILVMLDTRRGGDMVTKTHLQLSPDGKTLTLEVTHIAPPGGKAEKLVFARR